MSKNDRAQGADAPAYDPVFAQKLIGKLVLVGLTHLRPNGEVSHSKQIHGRIVSADPQKGFAIACEGLRKGQTYGLPADTRCFAPAEPGEYILHANNEVVENPDYLMVMKFDDKE